MEERWDAFQNMRDPRKSLIHIVLLLSLPLSDFGDSLCGPSQIMTCSSSWKTE